MCVDCTRTDKNSPTSSPKSFIRCFKKFASFSARNLAERRGNNRRTPDSRKKVNYLKIWRNCHRCHRNVSPGLHFHIRTGVARKSQVRLEMYMNGWVSFESFIRLDCLGGKLENARYQILCSKLPARPAENGRKPTSLEFSQCNTTQQNDAKFRLNRYTLRSFTVHSRSGFARSLKSVKE